MRPPNSRIVSSLAGSARDPDEPTVNSQVKKEKHAVCVQRSRARAAYVISPPSPVCGWPK
jgi:hypothetical protein